MVLLLDDSTNSDESMKVESNEVSATHDASQGIDSSEASSDHSDSEKTLKYLSPSETPEGSNKREESSPCEPTSASSDSEPTTPVAPANDPSPPQPTNSTTEAKTVYCVICSETVSVHEHDSPLWVCKETHEAGSGQCNPCMINYIVGCVNDNTLPIKCPRYECRYLLAEQEVVQILGTRVEVITKYQRFQALKKKNARDCPYCLNVQVGDPENPDMECNSCNRTYCFHHGPRHPGETCSDFKGEKVDWKLKTCVWKVMHTRKCPHCDHRIEKNGGCPCMTCKCGKRFCWNCGGKYHDAYGHEQSLFPNVRHLGNFRYYCQSKTMWAKRLGVIVGGLALGPPAASLAIGVAPLVLTGYAAKEVASKVQAQRRASKRRKAEKQRLRTMQMDALARQAREQEARAIRRAQHETRHAERAARRAEKHERKAILTAFIEHHKAKQAQTQVLVNPQEISAAQASPTAQCESSSSTTSSASTTNDSLNHDGNNPVVQSLDSNQAPKSTTDHQNTSSSQNPSPTSLISSIHDTTKNGGDDSDPIMFNISPSLLAEIEAELNYDSSDTSSTDLSDDDDDGHDGNAKKCNDMGMVGPNGVCPPHCWNAKGACILCALKREDEENMYGLKNAKDLPWSKHSQTKVTPAPRHALAPLI